MHGDICGVGDYGGVHRRHAAGDHSGHQERIRGGKGETRTVMKVHVTFDNLEFSEFCFFQHESRSVEFWAAKQGYKIVWSITLRVQ